MSKIPRILLDKKLIDTIKPVKGTLSFNSLSAEKIQVLCNLYNYFAEINEIKAIFSLRKLYQLCHPEEDIKGQRGERLNWKLSRFKDLLLEIESQRYSYPVMSGDTITVINERLFKLVIYSRPKHGSDLEDKIEIMTPDHRIKSVYELTGSENIKDEFDKYTKVTKNYIECTTMKIATLKGRQGEKSKKIQQVLNEEIATKKLRLKKKQKVEMETVFDLDDMAFKMGDLKYLKKNKTVFIKGLLNCLEEIKLSNYPVKHFELMDRKLIITFDPCKL
jgi:hypothetical protein